MISVNEKELRINKIKSMLQQKNVDAILLSSNVNLLYASGEIFAGYLYIPLSGDIMTFKRTEQDGCIPFKNVGDIVKIILAQNFVPSSISFEDEHILASDFLRLNTAFSGFHVVTNKNIMRLTRTIKTDYELAQISESAKIHNELYKKIPSLYKSGMTDIEFSVEIEKQARLMGHIGIFRAFGGKIECFMGSILSGKNAAYPSPFDFALGGKGVSAAAPVGACNSVMNKGETVMVDLSGNTTGYLSDMSRTFSVGEIHSGATELHKIALEIESKCEEMLKPGTRCCDIWDKAYAMVSEYNVLDNFMGTKKQARFLGHSLGLEINEPPVITKRDETLLQENMVIALEPKFVIEEIGAVGIEDTYIITKKGCEKITLAKSKIIRM